MERLIRQILNMVLRRGARHMMQRGGKGKQGQGKGQAQGQGQGQGANNAQRQSTKRAQQALRAGRKIGRF